MDHYEVLGLLSGEEALNLSKEDIAKAYRQKALELHPDKRRHDPDANSKFQRLKSSYDILKDDEARQAFDDTIRARIGKRRREFDFGSKRRKVTKDAGFHSAKREREEREERIAALKGEQELIARIRAMYLKKQSMGFYSGVSWDGGRVLRVYWIGSAEVYSVKKLKEMFGSFGYVEDVVSFSKDETNLAIVVMARKTASVAAMDSICRDLSNPLIVKAMKVMTLEEKKKMFSEMARKADAKYKSVS